MKKKTGDPEEKKINLYTKDQIIKIIEGYKELNKYRQMQEFLDQAKKCRKCQGLPVEKRPFNRILNNLDLNADIQIEANKITDFYKAFQTKYGREFYEPVKFFDQFEGKNEEFYKYIMDEQWSENRGLSIGVCGWTDATIFHSKPNPEIMIVGADWYPLRSQAAFIIERDDYSLLNPTKFLGKLFPGMEHEERSKKWEDMLKKVGVYFTNAMLCYRPQTSKVGNQNIASESFLYCQDHLESQIRIVKPKLIITWGLQPALSILRFIDQQTAGKNIPKELQELLSSNFKFKELKKLEDMTPIKIQAPWGGDVYIHILCHPSMPNRWGKLDDNTFLDYSNLRKWLGEKQWI